MDGMAWFHFRICRMLHLRFASAFKFVGCYRIAPTDSLIFPWAEKIDLTTRSKIGMELPWIPSLDDGKKVACPRGNSAVILKISVAFWRFLSLFIHQCSSLEQQQDQKGRKNLNFEQEESRSSSGITAKSVWSLNVGSCQMGSLAYLKWVGKQPLFG